MLRRCHRAPPSSISATVRQKGPLEVSLTRLSSVAGKEVSLALATHFPGDTCADDTVYLLV